MWNHIKILHKVDKLLPARQRICPKLTDAHVNLTGNKYLKMRVSLAVQVLILCIKNYTITMKSKLL